MKIAGFLLLVIGIIMMVYTGFSYITTEKIVDAGPIKISQQKNHPIKWSPVAGAVLFAGGIVLIIVSKKK